VISTTMTVCPTSGSQIEGDNLFEYRTFAMEDDGLHGILRFPTLSTMYNFAKVLTDRIEPKELFKASNGVT
jgi:hypothetical protein